ncbi:MAG: NTP transferase domain-containing protein [Lachnospiraceae bacterium]|jgi:thiamine kinase-like enzyme|nr:NTP transferase domain-containing protein [Lachnospiraceae bacterium]
MEYIIVQAGGKGTRLEHLTANRPKALVPVGNLPMVFHLFRRYPDKRFVVIADYKKEVMRKYLAAFAGVKYQVVDAEGTGTCAGVKQALRLLPESEPFLLVWSDLVLPETFCLPEEYRDGNVPEHDWIGISRTFPCRWKYENGTFAEEASREQGVAGFFLFTDKGKLSEVPENGELVRWMQQQGMRFLETGLEGTKEFGLLEEYRKLEAEKCRPFNRITVRGDVLVKEAVDAQGRELAEHECAWYEKARELDTGALPRIFGTRPLEMEYIRGKNIYETDLSRKGKQEILGRLVEALKKLHASGTVPADSFSIREAYYGKTVKRIAGIRDLVPFAGEKKIRVNGKCCRNVFYHLEELEKRVEALECTEFAFIHGDCTFSNLMVRENGEPVLIDPRGYFGYTKLYGDVRYDWAKLYYSIAGNYDQFNLKRFRLDIGKTAEEGVRLSMESSGWEDMEAEFFRLTGADPYETRLLHAIIWLSLSTYAWQDYDSVCGAFYNGLYYLEDVL